MRDSQPQSDPNDYLVMPGSSRGPPKSNVLNRANQIRAALHSVDQSEPIDYEQQYHHVHADYEQLRAAYEELQQFFEGQKESLENLETENTALRSEVGRLREGRQQEPTSLSAKYEKALKEISNLLGINKQLKAELEYFKNNSKEDYQRAYEELANQKNEESIKAQREQAKRIQLQKLNLLYEQKFHEIKQSMLKQQQLYQEKIMETIKAYSTQTQQLRRRAQRADQLQQQVEELQNAQHSGVTITEELRSKQAEYNREVYQLRQGMEELEVEAHQRQLALEREVENAKMRAQEDSAKAMRGLHQQLNTLKNQHSKLREAYEELQQDNSGLLEEVRRGSGKSGEQDSGVVLELKKYIENLKAETLRLREVLSSKDQLLADKANLNREIVNLNRQISQLSHENAQLKSRLEGTSKKEASLNDQIHRLQTQVEQQRAALALKLKQKESSIMQPSPTPPRSNPDHEQTVIRLNAQIESLKTKLSKALQFTSLEKTQDQQIPKNQRPIPVQIRIRELKVLLELLLGSSGGSSVTIQTSQLLDIRTFTVEFQERLKLLANQNEHLKRKVRDYKDRHHSIQKATSQTQQINNQLTSKISGYEKLVQRLQDELAKSIKKTQQTAGQFTLQSLSRGQLQADLRMQISDLNQKLQLQAKYFQQQLQTRTLQYQSRLVTMQKQVDTGSHELQSISLYTSKIQQLSDKLVRLQITNNELRVQLSQIEQAKSMHLDAKLPDHGHLLKQVYEKLTDREAQVLRLQYSLKDKFAELQENQEIQNQMKQQIYEQDLEIQRLKEEVRTAQEGEERIAYQAKRIDQEQGRKHAELTKINQNLKADVKKYQHFEEELAVAQQSLHQLKIAYAQVTEKASQHQSQLARLRQVQQNLRELALKYNELQNSNQYSKSVFQAQKSRLERYLKDKDSELLQNSKLLSKFRQEAANEIRQLRSQLGEVSLQTQTIRRNSELSKYRTTEMSDENSKLKAEINSLTQKMDRYRQAEARGYEQERRASELSMTVESMKYKMEFAVKEGQRMKNRIQELEETINQANMEVVERDRVIRTTQSNVYETNLKLQQQTFRNSSLKSEVDRLQKVVSDMLRESLTNSRKLVNASSASPFKVLEAPVSSFQEGGFGYSQSYNDSIF